jgi:hypothetical protein
MTRFPRLMILAATLALAGLASAQTLYKLVDKNGKVTYSESPPKEFDGTVTRMDIDPKANSATLPKGDALKAGPAAATETPALREARAKANIARKRLEDARSNPGPEDIQRVGTVSAGARAVPTEGYTKRLAELEEEVRRAEAEVQRLEPPPGR